MGGINSGRRSTGRHEKVERVVALDMRALRRLSFIRDGVCVVDTVTWRNARPAPLQGRLRVDLSDPDAAGATITIEAPGGAGKQHIAMVALPCRFGGRRWYFVCPALRCRCESLYLLDGRWASRRAHDLTYASQGLGELARATRRRLKLQGRLHGDGLTHRPRGTQRYTIAARLWAAVDEERALRTERLRRMVKADVRRSRKARSDAPTVPGTTGARRKDQRR